jgi:hypothetical protein
VIKTGDWLNYVQFLKVCHSIRGVSTARLIIALDFADPPKIAVAPLLPNTTASSPTRPAEPVIPDAHPPTTLIQWAVLILNTPDPVLKVTYPSSFIFLRS